MLLQSTLNDIRLITERNKIIKEERRGRGELFNIFAELNIMYSEVLLHTSFLALLLNPKASHGQGDCFLKLFLKVLDSKCHSNFCDNMDAEKSQVFVEKSIGPATSENGGRVDILVTDDKGHFIIIENKIYAADQNKQMLRYWNYAQEKSGQDTDKYRLVYLSLDGHSPSSESLCSLKEGDFVCMSYKDDILPWLKECAEISYRLPLIRETINQYYQTIRQITNVDMENTNDLLTEMTKEQNIDSVFAIANHMNDFMDNIINNNLFNQLNSLAERRNLNLQFSQDSGWMTESWAGWSFKKSDWKRVYIRMEFERRGANELIIGFVVRKGLERDALLGKITDEMLQSDGWIYKNFPIYPNWFNADAVKAILDGHTMIGIISSEIDKLLDASQGLEL